MFSFNRYFLTAGVLCALSMPLYATLSLDNLSYGGFVSTQNGSSVVSFVNPTMNVHFIADASVGSSNNTVVLNPITSSDIVAQFTGRLLNYPNPFSFRSGTEIGYQLTAPMDVELRIYTVTGYLVFRRFYTSTEEGGMGRYNRVPINRSTLNGTYLAPGVYIYALFDGGKLIAKNRMVVTP